LYASGLFLLFVSDVVQHAGIANLSGVHTTSNALTAR
jgi:hypothetical protein